VIEPENNQKSQKELAVTKKSIEPPQAASKVVNDPSSLKK